MKNKLLIFLAFAVLIIACTTNAITGRSQLSLVSEESLQQEAVSQYRSFLSQNKVVSSNNNRDAEMVKRVGNRIANAITKYYRDKGISKELEGYKWEFNLVDNKDVNAWCMPGGKVVVYTGLLNITKNEAALAIVMGHEITHAVARHGQERISQAFAAQGIGLLGDVFTSGNQNANQIFNAVFAPGAQVGVLLPNSRKQELEADHYGLIFAAMAGYNPREAIPFWQRMASAKNNQQQPPEILSSHPLDDKRIKELNKHMDEALKYYTPVK
ncbi:MAG: M48 family metallopeptidase [Ginsengibacter sp.]